MQQQQNTDSQAVTPRGSVLPCTAAGFAAAKHIGWAYRGRWRS